MLFGLIVPPAVVPTIWVMQALGKSLHGLILLLITIPPLLLFLFFQRQIVAGLTAGSVKG